MVSELGCSCERLVLNYVCWVLEKLLASKSVTQKQERAATVAALATLVDGSAAICVQAPRQRPVGCYSSSHLYASNVRTGMAACSGARKQGRRHGGRLRMGTAPVRKGDTYGYRRSLRA